MLQRHYRLPVTLGHTPLFTYKSPFFLVKVFRSPLPHPRFGFVVSKKTAPHAVTRNRVKRQVRSVIEQHLPSLKGGYDILFIVQKGSLGATTAEIKAAVLIFLSKQNLQR